jgi:hypothetical protein
MSEPAPLDVPALEGYDGPARLVTDEQDVEVEVRLRGQFQPLDGLYHWYGRVTAADGVDALVATRAALLLRTPHGDAAARLADRDPWGRYRVTGTGRPPFPV